MAFGFDHSIILSGKQYTGPDANETMRTLADLRLRAIQEQQAQVSLADMLQQRTQQQTLANIYRQNADAPQGLQSALMRGGFGKEALDIGGTQANQQKLLSELQERGMSILRNRAAAVKTPEQYAQFVSAIPPDARAKFGLPDQYDPAAVESFVAAGIPAEKRAEHEETKRHHREMEKRPTGGAGTIIFGEGGTTYRLPGTPGAPAQVVTDETGKPITKPAAGTGAGGGKELSASVLNELADYDTAQKQLDELFEKAKTENISGAGARANQFVTDALGLQGTDAARFEGASAPVRQGVGTILEGGKLAAGDEGKYKNMLPRYGDSPAVLEEKKKALNKYLATRKAERIKALKAGGYAVPDAGPAASSDSPGQTKVVAGKTYFKKPNGKWAVRE